MSHLTLEEVYLVCEEKRLKLTPLRKLLLTHLYQANMPLTAYALLDKVKIEQPKIKAMSVYRILDFFIENLIVHRIESLNAYAVCTCPEQSHQSQWLICDSCENVIELPSKSMEAFLEDICQSTGFNITKPMIELLGTCTECQKNL